MTMKTDKERMGHDMKYVIDSKTYEKHINDEVHLYGLLHQLAFLAGKVKDDRDIENLLDTAKRYGEIADEKFNGWGIPGRFLVFGDRKDLAELKAAELTPLTDVLKAHDRERAEKERTAEAGDPAYIISGSSFRLLVGDLFTLLAQYSSLRNKVLALNTSAKLTRLQKFLGKENPVIRRLYRGWGIPDDKYVTAADMMEQAISHTHLKPYTEPDGFGGNCCCDLCGEYPCDDEYDY